ncbi:hypothetical protein LDENG_00191750 [Lucifuga dentata]|nr:hypothetical protein LDENG_00191750 [Lucifuga dentata]
MKPEISRYSSLKKLEKELDEYTSYYSSSKRRPNNAPPSFHSSQHYLPWGGDYTLGSRGTLPLHGSRPHLHIPASTPNPYPLPSQTQHTTSSSFDRPPRRVRSQDQLLAFGEGNTLSCLSKNQQHQYYKAMMSRSSASQMLRRSHERLLVSPDRLEDRLLTMAVMGGGGDRGIGGGMVPTMGHLSHHQKAQSQQNICVTPSMDRHHMIKMNSHPTPGHDHDRSSAMTGMGMHGGWDPHGGHGGGGTTGGHPSARRMAFATKRQNTIEQLHFIPGGGGGQGLRTGSKNEVTV